MGRHSWAPSLGRLPGSLRLEKKGEPPPGAVLSTPKMHHQHWDAQARCKQAVCIPHCKDACIALKSAWGGSPPALRSMQRFAKMHSLPPKLQGDGSASAPRLMQCFAKMHALLQKLHQGGSAPAARLLQPTLCKNACIMPKNALGVGVLLLLG